MRKRIYSTRKEIYLEIAHHPQVVLDEMEGLNDEVLKIDKNAKLLRVVLIISFSLLIVVGLVSSFMQICFLWPFILLVTIVGGAIFFSSDLVKNKNLYLRNHFEYARKILKTLRDDTGRKGRVIGWLDLTGYYQEKKKIRTTRNPNGKEKTYYQDPWLKLTFKLVDGNILRFSIADKVKTKAGSVETQKTQFKARLLRNCDVYQVIPIDSINLPLRSLELHQQENLFVLSADLPSKKAFEDNQPIKMPEYLLNSLKAIYTRLNPAEDSLALEDK